MAIGHKPDMSQSLYSSMGNNPILYTGPLGDTLPKWIKNTGNFFKGAGSGIIGGLKSTGNFVQSLGTAQGRETMGAGLMDFADRLNPNSPTGMRKNIGTGIAVTEYISTIPNMSAEELGHDIGFGLEKIGEAALLSKGAGAVSNVLKGGEVVEVANAVEGGRTIIRSVGADLNKAETVLQTGGHTMNKSTLKASGLTKEQVKNAIEVLKKTEELGNDFHGK